MVRGEVISVGWCEALIFVQFPCTARDIIVCPFQICTDHVSCEIDPTRLKDGENIQDNMVSLPLIISIFFSYPRQGNHTVWDFFGLALCKVFGTTFPIAKYYTVVCMIVYELFPDDQGKQIF